MEALTIYLRDMNKMIFVHLNKDKEVFRVSICLSVSHYSVEVNKIASCSSVFTSERIPV